MTLSPSIRHLIAQWPVIRSTIEKTGFVQLTLADSKISTLKEVASLFGPIQRHARSPVNGITEIAGNVLQKKGQVNSSIEFFPHTDGHYLQGMMRTKNGKFYRIQPPKFFLLQCVKQAREGGMNLLIDATKILHTIIEKDQGLIGPLFLSKNTAILRGEHLVLDAPIFSRLSPKRYAIRFSFDQDFFCSPSLKELFTNFNERYILNQQYSSYQLLKPCQILVVDNHRMLHGRTAFVGERLLRRLWIYDDLQAYEMVSTTRNAYFESQSIQNDPLRTFVPYTRKKGQCKALFPIKTGIYISNKQELLLKEHLKIFI